MYGRAKKCKGQIDADNEFIAQAEQNMPSRDSAARFYLMRAWQYYNSGDDSTAMKRFNQAWLLDSTNAGIYWGYGILSGKNKQYKESIDFFNRSLQLDSTNADVWESASTSYGSYFLVIRDERLLLKAVEYLKKSLEIHPNNARAYSQLAALYFYYSQHDSAKKYSDLTDELDSTSVDKDVRNNRSK